jgi:hypothetical protein
MNRKFVEPEWLTLQGANSHSSISISELYRRCMTEEILSVHIVKPGKRKGVRLVNKKSLDEFIQSYLPGGSRHQGSRPKEAASV